MTGFVSNWPGGDDFGVMETDPTPSRTSLMVAFSAAFPIKHRAKAVGSVEGTRQVCRFPDPFKKSATTFSDARTFKPKSLVLGGKSVVYDKNHSRQDHGMSEVSHRCFLSHEVSRVLNAEAKLLQGYTGYG